MFDPEPLIDRPSDLDDADDALAAILEDEHELDRLRETTTLLHGRVERTFVWRVAA